MRSFTVSGTAAELPLVAPFLPGYTVTVVNATATDEILQTSDAADGDFTTLATVVAGESMDVILDNNFVKLASAGKLILLGN